MYQKWFLSCCYSGVLSLFRDRMSVLLFAAARGKKMIIGHADVQKPFGWK